MEWIDKEKKDAEMETERQKLQDLRQLILKAEDELKRGEESLANEKVQHAKTMRNLSSIRATLELKLKKLTAEIDTVGQALQKKTEEVRALSEYKEEKEKKIKYMQDYESTYWERIAELDRQVKKEYAEYQNERETKVLVEYVKETISEENKRPILLEVFKKKKEYAIKRQEDLKVTKEKLNEEENCLSKEVEELKEKLGLLKKKYSSLAQVYAMSKKAKELVQAQ